jgi:hypothetical protein
MISIQDEKIDTLRQSLHRQKEIGLTIQSELSKLRITMIPMNVSKGKSHTHFIFIFMYSFTTWFNRGFIYTFGPYATASCADHETNTSSNGEEKSVKRIYSNK